VSKGVFTNKIPVCIYCKKEFHATRLVEHQEICTLKPSTTSYNNNINDITDSVINVNNNHIHINVSLADSSLMDFGKFFTDEKIAEIFKDFKSEHALDQMKGLAKFVIEKILLMVDSPGYFVKDARRNIYAYEQKMVLKQMKMENY
jgi:hypothetical protein